MSDMAKPGEGGEVEILDHIQTFGREVLTTSEVAEGFPDKRQRSILRNLKWMRHQDLISGRKVPEDSDNPSWLWWVSTDDLAADNLSAAESVASARQIARLLSNLYSERREFQLMAAGGATILGLVGVLVWTGILTALGVVKIGLVDIFALVGGGFLLSFILLFIGIFLFPIETLGSWPLAVEHERENE